MLNEIKISKNFQLKDFQCPCCKRVMLHPFLLEKMEKIYEETHGNFKITSGYRCESHNKEVGGVKNSKHMMGRACDITSDNLEELYSIAKKLNFSFAKIDQKKKYIHVEV